MNMKNKVIFGVLVVIVIALGGFVSIKNINSNSNLASVIGANQNTDTIKIKVADLPVVHALPLYVAMEKGYFEEVGLDMEHVKLDSPNVIIDALLSGQVDMTSPSGAMGIAGIASFRQPGVLEIYASTGGDENQRSESLMTTQEGDINSFADLKGKKMGILPGIQWRTISKHLLSAHGLEADKDVMLVELAPGLQVGALASSQIDVLLAIEPMTTIAEKAGMKEVVKSPNLEAIANPFYPGAGVVRTDFANENPEAVEKFMDVIEKAIEDIKQDPDEARTYLSGYTPLDDELIKIAPIMLTKLYKEFTEEDLVAIEKFHQVFTTHGVIKGEIDTRGIIYRSRK